MNFPDDVSSIPTHNFKDQYILVFNLNSTEDAAENSPYAELVEEPLKVELNFTFPLEHVTEVFVLGERMASVAVDKFGVGGQNI